MRNLATAVAVAMLSACAGYTSGPVQTGGIPTGGGTLDGGGDAGLGEGMRCRMAEAKQGRPERGRTGGPPGPRSVDVTVKSNVAAPRVGLGCTEDKAKLPEVSSPTAAVLAMRSSLPLPHVPLGTAPV